MADQSTERPPLGVVLCSGSDCAKDERKAYRALRSQLSDADLVVERSECLGVCHGPVAVLVDHAGRSVVVKRVRTDKQRKRLVAAASEGRLGKARDAAPASPGDKKRKRALRRAGRVLGIELRAA